MPSARGVVGLIALGLAGLGPAVGVILDVEQVMAYWIGWLILTAVATGLAVRVPRTPYRLGFSILIIAVSSSSQRWVSPCVRQAFGHTDPRTSASAATAQAVAGYQVHLVSSSHREVRLNNAPVFILKEGHLARFRFTPRDDHWLGTKRHPVNLGWGPVRFPGVEVAEVSLEAGANGFSARVTGHKPDWPGARFLTTVTGQAEEEEGPLRYTIRSELFLDDAAAFRDLLPRAKVEYLDIWVEGVFWPGRDGHDRELYEHFLFAEPDGTLRSAPKLHVFPSLRKTAYRTLARALSTGGFIGFVDSVESGFLIRIEELSAPGEVGICWWTWDPHLTMRVPHDANSLVYEVAIEQFPRAEGQALLARAKTIPFRDDPQYQVPVFTRDMVNTFGKLLDHPDEWAWEPQSRRCSIDERVGYDDSRSVTIRSEGLGRTAWYARALGVDYFDHRPLEGGYRVRAVVKTRDVAGGARLGVLCYNGPETWLYEEPEAVSAFSQGVHGTNDWTSAEVRFDATGYSRFKIVLEQDGRGQSWFDNVSLSADPSALGVFREAEVLDLRNALRSGSSQPLNLRDFEVSRPRMLEDAGRLTLAWERCLARSRRLHLSAGRYQFVMRAEGEGCREDAPVLLAEVPGVSAERVLVTPDRIKDYALAFGLSQDKIVRLSLTFMNDGVCSQDGRDVDKNIFVEAVRLQPIEASASEQSGKGGAQ